MSSTRPCLLREESFGGTLFNPNNGRRVYLDRDELHAISTANALLGYQELIRAELPTVVVRRPPRLHLVSFSAPDRVFFELTRGCNLRCTHCFNASGVAQENELSPPVVMELTAALSQFGVQEIRFTGGEPLAAPSLSDYVREAAAHHLRTSIGTNATLATPLQAKQLADAGLDEAIVSIDGLRAKHDRIRGRGSFNRTLEGMRALVRNGVRVRINMVVMRQNLDDVLGVVRMAEDEGLSIMLRRFIASGRVQGEMEIGIEWGEYVALRERLRPWLDAEHPFVDGHYLKDGVVEPRITLPFSRSACSAGQRGMVILPDGKVQSCGFLAPLGEPAVGRVSPHHLAEIWERLVTSRYLAERRAELNQSSPSRSWGNECLALIETGQKH